MQSSKYVSYWTKIKLYKKTDCSTNLFLFKFAGLDNSRFFPPWWEKINQRTSCNYYANWQDENKKNRPPEPTIFFKSHDDENLVASHCNIRFKSPPSDDIHNPNRIFGWYAERFWKKRRCSRHNQVYLDCLESDI